MGSELSLKETVITLSDYVKHTSSYIGERFASWNGYLVVGVSKKIYLVAKCVERCLEWIRNFQIQKKDFIDESKLRATEKKDISIPKCKFQWYLNLGLLMPIYKRTQDPEVKKLVAFLVNNYLGKAAPICPNDVEVDAVAKRTLYNLFQLHLVEPGTSYNRECALFDDYVRETISAELASGSGNPFFLTDTKNIEELFPLRFSVMENWEYADEIDRVRRWASMISLKIEQHCAQHLANPLAEFFDSPLLLDLTALLERSIYTSGNVEKNTAFDQELQRVENQLEQAIDRTIQPFCETEETKEKFKTFIIVNTICVCRCEINEVGVLKMLPVFCNPKYLMCNSGECELLGQKGSSPDKVARAILDIKFCKSKANIEDFLSGVGIRLGSVKGRRKIFDFITLEQFVYAAEGILVEYAVERKNCLYFEKKLALTDTPEFKRFKAICGLDKPYLEILGKSTIQLLEGLLSEIDEEKWNEVNSCPDRHQIVQTSLLKINTQLAEAEKAIHDFSKFSQSIELIHYEIAALLAIFTPFDRGDFAAICKKSLADVIPTELTEHVKFGLTKSAMNTFAGLSVALRKSKTHPVCVLDAGSHFEIIQFVGGTDYCLDNVLKNKDIQCVDLYLGAFNHNVKLLASHSEYTPGDIIKEVCTLLEAKPLTEHLTVVVDSTIDFIHSSKVKALLQHFSKEIREGKLNIVVISSEQKYGMFGMDDYYGSRWWMVNNGASQWDAFDLLSTNEAFQTDSLSMQWFCLAYRYALRELDLYRKAIFDNTKEILGQAPEPEEDSKIRVCKVAEGMETGFIDIKCFGDQPDKTIHDLERFVYNIFTKNNLKIHSRGGYGYFNPNVNLFREGLDKNRDVPYATMRLHPGIDHEENRFLIEFLKQATNALKS